MVVLGVALRVPRGWTPKTANGPCPCPKSSSEAPGTKSVAPWAWGGCPEATPCHSTRCADRFCVSSCAQGWRCSWGSVWRAPNSPATAPRPARTAPAGGCFPCRGLGCRRGRRRRTSGSDAPDTGAGGTLRTTTRMNWNNNFIGLKICKIYHGVESVKFTI